MKGLSETIRSSINHYKVNGLPDFFIYFISNIFVSIIPFLLLPILTRAFTTSEYGLIGMFSAVLAFLYSIIGLKSESILSIKFFSASTTTFKNYLISSIYILLISALLIILASLIFIDQIRTVTFLDQKFIFLGIFVAISNVFITIRLSLWMVQKKPYPYAFFHSALAVLNISLSLLLVFIFNMGFEGRLYGIASAIIIFGIISLYSLLNNKLLTVYPRKDELIETSIYAYPLVFHAMSYTILATIDRYFISKNLGLDQLGIYVVAVQLSSIMIILVESVSKSFLPIVYEALNSSDYQKKVAVVRDTYKYCLFYFCIAMAIAMMSKFIILIMAGDKYFDAILPFIILLFAHVFYGFYEMFSHYLFFKQQTVRLSSVTVFVATLCVILIIFLLPIYGLIGASLAFLLSAIVRFLIILFLATRAVSMPWLK